MVFCFDMSPFYLVFTSTFDKLVMMNFTGNASYVLFYVLYDNGPKLVVIVYYLHINLPKVIT